MKHISEGILRAYFDEALSATEQQRVAAHLAVCPRCAEKAASIKARGARVQASITSLSSPYLDASVEAQVARERLRDYVYEKKENTMLKKAFSRRYRPAWVAVAFVLFFAAAFSFQPVRALASDFLALFRVQKIEFVEADIEGLDDDEAFQAAAGKLEGFVKDQVVFVSGGKTQHFNDVAEVRSLVDYTLRFPTAAEGEAHYVVQPDSSVSMQVDVAQLRMLLAELGYTDIDLPDSLDGAAVGIAFDASVVTSYGDCIPESEEWETAEGPSDMGLCTVFMQIPSPNITAPAELDIDQLGQAYLQLLGMTPEEASTFSQQVDWTTTMVVPIPNVMHMNYQEIQVDGVDGAIIYSPSYHSNQDEYVLTWVKDGIIYSLSGVGNTATALELAASIE